MTGSAYLGRARAGLHFGWAGWRQWPKASRRISDEQLDILVGRGRDIGDRDGATAVLRRVNYYRLSGYWYSFRKRSASEASSGRFFPGTRFNDVVALYDFDVRLRAATFAALIPVELVIRALLAYELGRIGPCAHLDPSLLGPTARSGDSYRRWLERYEVTVRQSREDFVVHHNENYGGRLPVWAATELFDCYLYGFAPPGVQEAVADVCGLSWPQLRTWLKALNLVRNVCAHHGHLFNRVHTIKPKLPRVRGPRRPRQGVARLDSYFRSVDPHPVPVCPAGSRTQQDVANCPQDVPVR